MKARHLALVVSLVLGLAVACGSSSHVMTAATPGVHSPPSLFLASLGQPGCAPPLQVHDSEIGADSSRGSLWALFFGPLPPAAGMQLKVVWRMTGSGPITFRVTDAGGNSVPLAWGPEGHLGSNWNHPGDEVGTGFSFPHAGCWDIHVSRADVSGDLWLQVVG